MRKLATAVLLFCCFATAASGASRKEECAALKKAVAEAQATFNKAMARFRTADAESERASAREEAVQKSLATNSDRIAVQRDFVNDAAADLATCRQASPSRSCDREASAKKAAEDKLQKFEERQAELRLDLAQAQSWREQKEAELAAAHQEANAAKQALDAAVAALAAADCKVRS